MKAALVGCGKIAYWHIMALKRLPDVRIEGVCDRDKYRARTTAEMVGSARFYSDFGEMLAQEHPDVVHILTPPDSHAALAIQAAQAGCHILVEKPMALSTEEADQMLAAARSHGVRLCVSHNYLFKPSVTRARQLVNSGAIGHVVYVDSYYGLSGEGGSYAGSAGRTHWAFSLPGSTFTNFIPHLIYLQLAFLQSDVTVTGVSTASPSANGAPPSELAVTLQGEHACGTMAVSMRAKPYAKFIDIYGTRGIIHADLVREVCTVNHDVRLPRMISKVVFNLESSGQLLSGTVTNTARVLFHRLPNMPGLHALIHAFYASLPTDQRPPVPGEDGRQVIEIMEMIWSRMQPAPAPPRLPSAIEVECVPQTAVERRIQQSGALAGQRVLVTGATGFLGNHLVQALARCGAVPVALVRDAASASPALRAHAELIAGDLRDADTVRAAMTGVDVVFHCAAVTTNQAPWRDHDEVTVQGTRTVLSAAQEAGVRRVVHVSSVIVYGLDGRARAPYAESTPYPSAINPWAYYMRAKIAAEEEALTFSHHGLSVVIVRPGILYGPGSGRLPGRGLTRLGRFNLVIGSGRNHLPFTYVTNAVDALLLAAVCPLAESQIYNVVDEPQPTLRDIIRQRQKVTEESMVTIPLPAGVLIALARWCERRCARNGTLLPPKLSQYVIESARRNICYDTCKARTELGWAPEVSLQEGLRRTAASGVLD